MAKGPFYFKLQYSLASVIHFLEFIREAAGSTSLTKVKQLSLSVNK
jgi:hypothetical protein